MKKSLLPIWSFVAAAAAALSGSGLRADITTVDITQLYSGAQGYADNNHATTFSGTGYVGIYPTYDGGSFAQLMGLENPGDIFSETEMDIALSGLAGDVITSATLSFDVTDGGGTEGLTISSFGSTGTLGYNAYAPAAIGSVGGSVTSGNNSYNVTSLIAGAVNANDSYVGLYLTPDGSASLWTYSEGGVGDDSAHMRLTINYAPAAVPDSGSSWVLAAIGLGMMALFGRRLKRNAAAA